MNNFDRGMNDAWMGKEPPRDATLEYLQGYGRAEALIYPEQKDNRMQEDYRTQEDDRGQENLFSLYDLTEYKEEEEWR